MPKLPFDIPQSLSTYVEQFDDDPEKVTEKLKTHVKRRGLDAVGYFLLAWFYHLRGKKEKAIDYALRAKTYAPGSPLMEHLHYYLVHPRSFDAWVPPELQTRKKSRKWDDEQPGPHLDLDALIAKLSELESTKIAPPENLDELDETDLSEKALKVDDIASETLANIYQKQGKTEMAIETYQKLKKIHPDKTDYYDQQINSLQEEDSSN